MDTTKNQPEPVVIRFDTCGESTLVTVTSQIDPTRTSEWDFEYGEEADEFVARFSQRDDVTVVMEVWS